MNDRELLAELQEQDALGLLSPENAAIAAGYDSALIQATLALALSMKEASQAEEDKRATKVKSAAIRKAQKAAEAARVPPELGQTYEAAREYLLDNESAWGRWEFYGTGGGPGTFVPRNREAGALYEEARVAAVYSRKALEDAREKSQQAHGALREAEALVVEPSEEHLEQQRQLFAVVAVCEQARPVIKARELRMAARALDERDGLATPDEPDAL